LYRLFFETLQNDKYDFRNDWCAGIQPVEFDKELHFQICMPLDELSSVDRIIDGLIRKSKIRNRNLI